MSLSREQNEENILNFDEVIRDVRRLKEIFKEMNEGKSLPRDEISALKNKYLKEDDAPFYHDEESNSRKPILVVEEKGNTLVTIINNLSQFDPKILDKTIYGAAASINNYIKYSLPELEKSVINTRGIITGAPLSEVDPLDIEIAIPSTKLSTESKVPAKTETKPEVKVESSEQVRNTIFDFINKQEKAFESKANINFEHLKLLHGIKEDAEDLHNKDISFMDFRGKIEAAIKDFCKSDNQPTFLGFIKKEMSQAVFEKRSKDPKNVLEFTLNTLKNKVEPMAKNESSHRKSS